MLHRGRFGTHPSGPAFIEVEGKQQKLQEFLKARPAQLQCSVGLRYHSVVAVLHSVAALMPAGAFRCLRPRAGALWQ